MKNYLINQKQYISTYKNWILANLIVSIGCLYYTLIIKQIPPLRYRQDGYTTYVN